MDNKTEDDLVTVDFDLPFAIHISDEPLDVDVKGTRCTLRFAKVQRENLDPRLRLGGGDFDLSSDRFGWVRYSNVRVSMPLHHLPPCPRGMRSDEWPIEIATSAVNYFLAHYRDLLGLPWIRPINPTEVWTADVTFYEQGSPPRIVRHSRLHQVTLPVAGLLKDVEQTLRQRVVKSECVSPWKLLLLDAEDALTRGDARLAVILGQTAIEGAVGELLIRGFHEKRPSLDDVSAGLRLRRKPLSYESAVEMAGVDDKLSHGLRLAIGTDPSTNFSLWYEWDIANATRVACVHRGYSPPLGRARTVLDTYWRIYREYLEQIPLGGDSAALDPVSASISAMTQALGQPPSGRLSALVQRIVPILQKRLIPYPIYWLPVALDRAVDILAEERDDSLAFWLNPDEDSDKNEMHIAAVLVHFELLAQGYPFSRVSDTLPPMVSQTGWELIAQTLTWRVLKLPQNLCLKQAGFPVGELAKHSLESSKKRLLASDYVPPDRNEVRARTLPLEVMALYFCLEEESDRHQLLELVATRATDYVENVQSLLKAVQQTGFETREKCVELMVQCRNYLMMLDSCLVVDPVGRLVYYSQGPQAY